MEMSNIVEKYIQLQSIYGDPNLDAIISGGEEETPSICFLFMNPTGRNIASNKEWKGIKSPWIGTKNIWNMFRQLGMLDEKLYAEIQERKAHDWNYDFASRVYDDLKKRGMYVTNLAKCTQTDARALPASVFKEYRYLLLDELKIVKPKKVVTFGNQVSSIFLNAPISISKSRRKVFNINGLTVMPTYYPVGQGRRNMGLAIEDIEWFVKEV
jgi:DNA polymerase